MAHTSRIRRSSKSMKPAAIYVRVSTTKESQEQSIEAQTQRLKDYCAFRKWEFVVFYEQRSGMKGEDKRPALSDMMNQVRAGKFSAILVTNFTRFGRHPLHLVQTMYELKGLGVDFVAVEQSIDTTSPMGEVIFVVFAALAKMQRDMIRESVLRGLANAREKGAIFGRPRQKVNVEELAALSRSGLSLRQIENRTGVNRMLVSRRLKQLSQYLREN